MNKHLELMEKLMMETIKFFNILFICLFISCRGQEKVNVHNNNRGNDIFARYITNNYPYKTPNYEEIIIFKDSVANYNLSLELYGTHKFIGTWRVKNDTLDLFFPIPPVKVEGNIKVHYEKVKQDKLISIKVINDKGAILDGNSIFINDIEHLISLQNLRIDTQFIEKIKIDFYGEIYETKINKYVDSDITIILTPHEWRNAIYDFIKKKWLVKKDRIIELKNNKINENYFLLKKD